MHASNAITNVGRPIPMPTPSANLSDWLYRVEPVEPVVSGDLVESGELVELELPTVVLLLKNAVAVAISIAWFSYL